jgi:hypothetical protein
MKLVNESIEEILKPKSEEDINRESNEIIDRFINSVTEKDFLKSIKRIRSQPLNYIRILKIKDEIVYLTNKHTIIGIIDDLAFSTEFSFNASGVIYKFPEFNDLLMNLLKFNIKDLLNKIIEKLSKKFNIEYE